jgi:hypothetical protein
VIALRLIELEIEIVIFSNERGGVEEFFHANYFKSGAKMVKESQKATAINPHSKPIFK